MVRNKFVGTLLILLLVSCSDKEGNETKEKYLEGNASLFWEISGNGLDDPSYLYGTIHMIDEAKFRTGDNLELKFNEVDYLVMEVRDITNAMSGLSVMNELYLDSGELKDYVDSALYVKFLQVIEDNLGISKTDFESRYSNMKPFALYTIAAGMEEMGPQVSYELYFMDLAYEHNLDVEGLETMEDQLSFFDKVTFNDMFEYMIQTLESTDTSSNEIERLGDIYMMQDLDSLHAATTNSDDVLMSKYGNIFLDGRNKNWIPKIEELISNHRCFIAVGAAHLPGENGVINLLRKEGYTVRPISID